MSEPIPADPDFPPEDPVPPEPDPVEPGEEQPVVDGWTDAPVSGDRVNVFDAPIVAGDPDGARIEIRSTGFHAFNGVGTETAHIDGQEGVFVGGEFRTSDTLPGSVRIADDAFNYSGRTLPGIEIIPEDRQSTVLPAGVGPWGDGAALAGGEDSSGRSAKLHATPTQAGITSTSPTGDAQMYASSSGASMRATRSSDGDSGHVSVDYTGANLTATDGESGEYGRILASPRELRMSLLDGSGNATGGVRVIAGTASVSSAAPDGREAEVAVGLRTGARVGYTSADGVTRSLSVDSRGVWVKTNKGGSSMNYNLEETAQDSGWAMATVASGYTAQPNYPPKARKVGNLVYLSGGVSGAGISANTSQYVLTLPPGYRPVGNSIYVVGGSSTGAACPLFVIQPDGRVSLRTTATTGSYYLMDGLSFIPE